MEYQAKDNLEVMKNEKNYNNFIVSLILKVIKKNSCKKIVDFGCSDGYFMDLIKNKMPEIELFGVDSDENYFKDKENKNDFYVNLDSLNGEFDLIYSLNTLEHIFDDVEILKKINSKLKDDGKIFLYLPAFNWLFSSMDVKTGHFRRYNKKSIEKKLNQSGFKIEKIKYSDFLGVFITLIYILKDKIKTNNGNISKFQVELYDKIFFFCKFLDIFFSPFVGKNLFVIASKK